VRDDDVEPIVSVIIPTYNRIRYLREAVDSVRRQSWQRWEVIIVDDGSTDDTQAYLARLTDRRVLVERIKHCGNPGSVRNRGLAVAQGDYVAFLDSDDHWETRKLEKQLAELKMRPAFRWSYTAVTLIDAGGGEIDTSPPRYPVWRPHSGMIVEHLLPHEAKIACPTVLVERSLLLEVGGFDESLSFCEDYDLWLRLAEASPVWALPEKLARVRWHEASTTYGRSEVAEAFVQVYTKFLRRQKRPGLRLRRVCNRQRAFYAVSAAEHFLRRRAYRPAGRQLLRALRFRPWHRRAWIVALKGALSPLMASRVIASGSHRLGC
jgi:glycosyltransferase involved in cell wall biosynthesis